MSQQLKSTQSRPPIQSDIVTRRLGAVHIGVSETTFWRLAEFDPTFPPKIRLSPRRVAWRLSALNAWLDSREDV
jgi:predicted DNA-binding transcriptional regulator AlpA